MLCIIFRAFYPICDYAVYFYGSSIASQAYQHVNAKFWISCESKLQRASCEECICLLLHMKRVMRFFFTHVTYVGGSLGFRATEPQTQTTSLIGLPACQRDGDDSVARRLVCVCVCVCVCAMARSWIVSPRGLCVCVCDGPFLTSIKSDCLQVIWGAFIEVCDCICLNDCEMTLCWKSSEANRITESLQMSRPARGQSVDVGRPNMTFYHV